MKFPAIVSALLLLSLLPSESRAAIDPALQGHFESRNDAGQLLCEFEVRCSFGWSEWFYIGTSCLMTNLHWLGFEQRVVDRDGERMVEIRGNGYGGHSMFPERVRQEGSVERNDAAGSYNLRLIEYYRGTWDVAEHFECIGAIKVDH